MAWGTWRDFGKMVILVSILVLGFLRRLMRRLIAVKLERVSYSEAVSQMEFVWGRSLVRNKVLA